MSETWYRLAGGTLGLSGADPALAARFQQVYGDCAVSSPGDGPVVVCRTMPAPAGIIRIRFEDPQPLDEARFLPAMFPDRDYRSARQDDGTVVVTLPDGGQIQLKDGTITAPADSSWQPLAANLAVSRLLRLQRDTVFFHAASLAVRERGVLVCGPKRSGKTTMALGLAARGHALLGDEVAALRLADRNLLAFRRSLAVREGPATAEAARRLADDAFAVERFPDGEQRRRVSVAELGWARGQEKAPLTIVLILRHFTVSTIIRALPVGPGLIGSLTPMAASLWDRPAGGFALRLLAALASVKAFEMEAGPPDEAAEAIERLVEDA